MPSVPILAAARWLAPLAALATASSALAAESVTPLLRKDLPNLPGKVFTSARVSFAPGVAAAAHRHGQAFVYAYVLDGEVRSQLEGEPARTYKAGESWFEPPGAHHLLTQNASATQPADLLVVFVSNAGEPLKTDDKP